MLFQVKILKYL